MSSNIDKCALCCLDGQELQDSHFIPAGVYRVTRDESQSNPDPLKICDEGVFQDSKQVTDFLLCRRCEERLNHNGESWFLANCFRKNRFNLLSLVEKSTPEVSYPRMNIYLGSRIPELNVSALAYFPLSMFWRASVHRWKVNGNDNKGIELGPYEESLRKFLMGEMSFPQNCVLWVSLPENLTPIASLSLAPYGGGRGTFRTYKLLVLGVGFHLLIGKGIPQQQRQLCFVRGAGNPIHRTNMLEDSIIQDMNLKFTRRPHLLAGPGTSRRAVSQ
jgi:hypothetical protein